jgi:hypothetical protein
MNKYLYHLPNSKTINGFYQSEVFVIASSLDQAKERIRELISNWLTDIDEGGSIHNTAQYSWFDDWEKEEAKQNYTNKMNELDIELNSVVELTAFGIIRHHC